MELLSQLKPGDVLGQVDLGSYIGAMAKGVAEAQKALDDNTIGLLGQFTQGIDALEGKSLIQLGLSPAFYHFRSATISASVSMSIRVRQEIDVAVQFGGGKSSSSSSTTATNSHDATSAREIVTFAAGQTAEAHSAANSTAMESIDSYSWQNSSQSTHFVLAERAALTNISGLAGTGLVGFSSKGVYVVPPTGKRWAVIRLSDASTATDAFQLKAQGDYEPGAGLAPKALAAGIKTHLQGSVVLLLSSDGQAASGLDDLSRVLFETGSHTIMSAGGVEYAERVRALARIVVAAGLGSIKLTGRTDGVGPSGYNQRLSELRAEAVRDVLVANGVSFGAITIEGKGESEAVNNVANPDQRNVTIGFPASWSGCLLYVEDDAADLNQAMAPPASTGTNGVVASALYPVDGKGFSAGTATAVTTAAALETQFQTNNALTASRIGELVYLTNKEGGGRTIAKVMSYAASESSQDSSNSSNVQGQSDSSNQSTLDEDSLNTINRAAAIAGSVDARFSRMFDVSMAGNMSVAAELVSIPAPPEFLQFIKDYLED